MKMNPVLAGALLITLGVIVAIVGFVNSWYIFAGTGCGIAVLGVALSIAFGILQARGRK